MKRLLLMAGVLSTAAALAAQPPAPAVLPAHTTSSLEQLGLKLEAAKGPVEMIVIDSIEVPTED